MTWHECRFAPLDPVEGQEYRCICGTVYAFLNGKWVKVRKEQSGDPIGCRDAIPGQPAARR